MRHYRTWRTIRVPEEPGSPFKANILARLTELGMSPTAYITDMVNDETRIRFTRSPLGNVIGGWMNISIKLNQVDDFFTRAILASFEHSICPVPGNYEKFQLAKHPSRIKF